MHFLRFRMKVVSTLFYLRLQSVHYKAMMMSEILPQWMIMSLLIQLILNDVEHKQNKNHFLKKTVVLSFLEDVRY